MTSELLEVKTQEQLDACIAIRLEVFVEEQQVPAEEECDEYDKLDAPAYHVLLQQQGEYIATGRIKLLDELTAKMQRIAVRKSYRGQGIGRVLVLGMEQIARVHGVERSVLDAQCQAEGFYQSLGYVTISEEPFYDAGILHVRMEKKL
ncbi:GNAT family N-acetyltransferase [Paenibacillus agilis]|uniref:GNAT family N-acetyltransferase n=1 Tax=Paenibacillus agilis TaxID=3020863 RepID=A0A559J4E4_9BACL|nr:GNAT family N-acetyltransferase [Paenibacillus agilis]TVX94759.1 GNAT family N-acetyltransferase [Paenibacillus agilis]